MHGRRRRPPYDHGALRKNGAHYLAFAEFVAPLLGMQRFLSFLLDQNGAAR
jgi:hypothetical protein